MSNNLEYIKHDFGTGWPVAPNLFYLCERCGDLLSSIEDGNCTCGNVNVDTTGRAGADDESKVRLVKKVSSG